MLKRKVAFRKVVVFAIGAVVGAALGLFGWQRWGQASGPGTVTLAITVVDAVSGAPVAGDVSVWREGTSTSSVGDDPLFFASVQSLTVELHVGELTTVLVEAPGYQDWELSVRARSAKVSALSGPVRLHKVVPIVGGS